MNACNNVLLHTFTMQVHAVIHVTVHIADGTPYSRGIHTQQQYVHVHTAQPSDTYTDPGDTYTHPHTPY